MDIVIFGANGPTGRLLTQRALDAGHRTTALTRRPAEFPLSHASLRVVGGDALDPKVVDAVVADQHVALSALGVPYGRTAVTVYSEGARNILSAMERHRVRRFAGVTSSATEPNPRPQGGFFFEKVLQPFVIGVLGRTVYADMRRMEALVRESSVDWTIVRPSGLFNAETISEYRTGEGHVDGTFTARVDLADLLLRQATDDTWVRKFVAIATTENTPTMMQMLRSEAVGSR
ncbi:MAG: SDR family oxidoreductase [Pseudolysinimonas sp.]